MTSQKTRRRPTVAVPAVFAEARDELLHHIMQCGVIDSDSAHQMEWFNETMAYMSERYHELGPDDLAQLRQLGERFCQPPKTQTQSSGA
jgi:hypothetical protein